MNRPFDGERGLAFIFWQRVHGDVRYSNAVKAARRR